MTKHFTVPGSVVAVLAMDVPEFAWLFNDAAPPLDDNIIAGHRDRQQQLVNSMQDITARAEAETRDLTAAEQTEITGLQDEFDDRERQIGVRARMLNQSALLTAPRARQTEADPIDGDEPPAPAGARQQNQAPRTPAPRAPAAPRATAGGMGGFRHLGEFANAVRLASMRGGEMDPRLRNAAVSTYGNEGTGADGGFAVPADMRTEILSPVFNEESLIALTDRLQSSSNTLTLPTDSTTPWQTSGGIQAYWVAEAATKTQSKPVLGETTLKLHTLAVLVPVTEELLEDAPAMGAYLNRKAPEKIDFKVSDAIIRGTGVGQPLGILNSPALVTVAAEGAQTADTVNVTNLAKMWGRLPVQSRRTAVWLMHPDAEAQLPLMTIANQPVSRQVACRAICTGRSSVVP